MRGKAGVLGWLSEPSPRYSGTRKLTSEGKVARPEVAREDSSYRLKLSPASIDTLDAAMHSGKLSRPGVVGGVLSVGSPKDGTPRFCDSTNRLSSSEDAEETVVSRRTWLVATIGVFGVGGPILVTGPCTLGEQRAAPRSCSCLRSRNGLRGALMADAFWILAGPGAHADTTRRRGLLESARRVAYSTPVLGPPI